MGEYGLTDDERRAILEADFHALYRMGVHSLLLAPLAATLGLSSPTTWRYSAGPSREPRRCLRREPRARDHRARQLAASRAIGGPSSAATPSPAPARGRASRRARRRLPGALGQLLPRSHAIVLHWPGRRVLGTDRRGVREDPAPPGWRCAARGPSPLASPDVDLSTSQELAFDHGVMVPLHLLGTDLPVIPIIVNCLAGFRRPSTVATPSASRFAAPWSAGRSASRSWEPEGFPLAGDAGVRADRDRLRPALPRGVPRRPHRDLPALSAGAAEAEAGPGATRSAPGSPWPAAPRRPWIVAGLSAGAGLVHRAVAALEPRQGSFPFRGGLCGVTRVTGSP